MTKKESHVIWKRPDGFQNADPRDFRRVQLSNGAQIWLHQQEKDWYPFQVRGDWAAEEETIRLNRLIQLLEQDDDKWLQHVCKISDDSLDAKGSPKTVRDELVTWVESLMCRVRGDTWEQDIMKSAFRDVQNRLKSLKCDLH